MNIQNFYNILTSITIDCFKRILNILLSRSRLCRYSVGGAWWHLGFYELFWYPVRVIYPATGVESEGVNMTE
jgi:hypothetical protein